MTTSLTRRAVADHLHGRGDQPGGLVSCGATPTSQRRATPHRAGSRSDVGEHVGRSCASWFVDQRLDVRERDPLDARAVRQPQRAADADDGGRAGQRFERARTSRPRFGITGVTSAPAVPHRGQPPQVAYGPVGTDGHDRAGDRRPEARPCSVLGVLDIPLVGRQRHGHLERR